MALSYSPQFPKQFLDAVVGAESVAERQFRTVSGDRQSRKQAAVEYAMALVIAFARQACAAVRARELSLSEVGWFVDDFERRASVHAFYHLELSGLWSRWESFNDEVIPQIHLSSGWLDHLEDRERCAERADHARAPEAQARTAPKWGGPNLAAWLSAEMEKRDHMTLNRLHVLTGLDRKTIKALLAGGGVKAVRIAKLADGLSVHASEVPQD